MNEQKKITKEDVAHCWGSFSDEYFADVLNGDYALSDAISDIRSLIGSKYDPRLNLTREVV